MSYACEIGKYANFLEVWKKIKEEEMETLICDNYFVLPLTRIGSGNI